MASQLWVLRRNSPKSKMICLRRCAWYGDAFWCKKTTYLNGGTLISRARYSAAFRHAQCIKNVWSNRIIMWLCVRFHEIFWVFLFHPTIFFGHVVLVLDSVVFYHPCNLGSSASAHASENLLWNCRFRQFCVKSSGKADLIFSIF